VLCASAVATKAKMPAAAKIAPAALNDRIVHASQPSYWLPKA
jgi:hypothetical protein